MDVRSYADVLKFAIKMQIDYIREEGENGKFYTEYQEGYYDGMVRGLQIALEKIDASEFLMGK